MTYAVEPGAKAWGTHAKVLKRDEWASWHQAVDTHLLANDRLARVDAEIAEARRYGWDEGYSAGRVEGRHAGMIEVVAALQSEHVFLERLNDRIVSLIEEVVRGLLVEIDDPTWFRRRLEALLAKAGERKIVRLRVAPSCVEAAQAALTEVARIGKSEWVQVEADAALMEADVVIEANSAIFDGRISEQVVSLRSFLLEALRRPAALDSSAEASGDSL